jgi:hypothetical protein
MRACLDYGVSGNRGGLMKRWRWALLIFELVLFALILVLPQVDLPDFTFHGGTAPIVAKSRLSSVPVLSNVTTAAQVGSLRDIGETRSQPIRPAVHLNPHSLISLFCILLC